MNTIALPTARLLTTAALAATLAACGGGNGDTPAAAPGPSGAAPAPATPALVRYDFPAGDTLEARNGWTFANPRWPLGAAGDGSGPALPFAFAGGLPGSYSTSEMRFTMPAQDQFWLRMRWHVPANYAHRHDTELTLAGAATAGWQLGDRVRGTDGNAEGVISRVDDTRVFLRFAGRSAYDGTWTGQVTNVTRNSTLTSTRRSQWAANNKLLAIWTDDYSGHGLGPTIVWSTDLHWSDAGSRDTYLTVANSRGDRTGTNAPIDGGVLITAADHGRFMDLIFHARLSSAPGARDGVIRTYVRRQGETAYTQRHHITNADMDKRSDVAPELRSWRAGYLMGWSNSGFDAATTFHISQIEVFAQAPGELQRVTP